MQLFTRAFELVEEHGIRPSAFSGHLTPSFAVEGERGGIEVVLTSEFEDAMKIAGTLSFAVCLRRGVLTYHANLTGSTTVR